MNDRHDRVIEDIKLLIEDMGRDTDRPMSYYWRARNTANQLHMMSTGELLEMQSYIQTWMLIGTEPNLPLIWEYLLRRLEKP